MSADWGSAGAISGPPHLIEGRIRVSAIWGSAGAISGPPHLIEGRIRVSAIWGSAGAISGPPHLIEPRIPCPRHARETRRSRHRGPYRPRQDLARQSPQ